MTLPVTKEEIILYFNIAILAIIALFGLIGFIRGTRKSVYYMIATLIILLGGWFLSDIICNMLLDIDLSSMGQTFPIGEGEDLIEYPLTTIRETLTAVVRDQIFGGTMPEDSLILETVFAVIIMVLRIVYFFALILLSFTLFKLIFDIIWLIIRPKRKNKDGTRRKIGFGSRLGGFGIGAAKGLIYALLLCFMIAGITSIASNVSQLQEQNSDTTDTYTVIIINDTATLVKLSSDEESGGGNDMFEEYGEIIDMLGFYQQTIAGQVFGSIKIGDSGIDEYVFDELFAIKVKDGETTHDIKLRKELRHAANALMKIDGLLTGEFSMDTLASMDKEVLNEVIDELTSLELINVAIPVGIEILLANEKTLEGIENESLRAAIKNSLSGLRGLDYNAELKEIGYVFVDVVQILQFNEEGALDIDFLSLDPDTIEEIFNKLGKLGLVDVVAPLFVEYLCSMESLQESFENIGLNIDEILHPEKYDPNAEPIDWSDEISNIGKVYKAFAGLGLKTEDFKEMHFEFSDENIAAVDNLVDQIFNSRVIAKAIPVLVDLGKSQMPEDFATIISIPDSVDWSEELKPLLKAALVLFSSGLFSEEGDMTTRLGALTDEKIEQLAEYFSQSNIIKSSLTGLINQFLAPSEGGEGVFGDIELVSLDSADDWTKTEISSIFKAIKLIISSDIIGSDDVFKAFTELSDETVNDLATDLSSSKFIRKNLSSILTYFLDQMSTGEEGLKLVSLKENEWTKSELSSIFFALIDIAKSDMLNSEGTDGIKNLSDEIIDSLGTHISSSKFLRTNLTEIMDMLLSSIDLGEGIEIKGFEDADEWTKLEIVSLLKSARLIVNYTDDLTKIVNISEDDLDILTGSRLITNTLVSFIKAYAAPGKSLEVVKGVDMVADDEWADTNTLTTFNLVGTTLTINSVANTDKYYIYVDGKKVASTENAIYDLSTLEGVTATNTNTEVYAKEFGEIRRMFVSIQTLVGDDFNAETISDDIVKSLTSLTEEKISKIIASKIIAETIITKIEEFAEGDSAFISIPEGPLTKLNDDSSKDRSAWLEQGGVHGELFKLLRAVTVVFAGQDLGSSSFEFSTDLITNIHSDDIHKITESLVINETLIQKIEDMSNEESATIYIPAELQATPTTIDRDKWMAVDETGNLLVALKSVFSGGTVDTANLFIEPIIGEKDEILKSLVICETVKRQITKPETSISIPAELEGDDLDGWKNEYYSDGSLKETGELSDLLGAVKIILGLSDSGSTKIDEIKTDNIKLSNMVDQENQDVILRSLVISETIKNQITADGTGISIPSELNKEVLTGWKNTYSGDTVTSRGEISALLGAIKIILGIDENSTSTIDDIKTDDIKLSNMVDQANQDVILRSLVISETIKNQITADGTGISIPAELDKEVLTGWKNTYDGNTVTSRGEISALLGAIKIILAIDENSTSTIDDIKTDDIKLANMVDQENQDVILRSLVISETIKNQITADGTGISIPTELDKEVLTGWKNTYSGETVTSHGEISALLGAIKIILDIDENSTSTIDDIKTDDIKLANIVDEENQDVILRSLVITQTIKDQITENGSGIVIPENEAGLSKTDLDGWKNTYSGNTVTSRGEIAALLTSVGIVLNINNESTTSINNIKTDDIKLQNVIDNQDDILKSLVITATIKSKIEDMDKSNGGSLPITTYDIGLSSDSLDGWKNTYDGDTVESHGEISALLNAISIILTIDNNTKLDEFSTDNIKLGRIVYEKDVILKSLIISSTIREKIEDIDSLQTPDDLADVSDLTGWKSTYDSETGDVLEYGELARLLTSIKYVLNISVDDDSNFNDINVDNIKVNALVTNRQVILHSIILAETIKEQVLDNASTDDSKILRLPAYYLNSASPNYISWYDEYNDTDYNNVKKEFDFDVTSVGELDKLLAAIGELLADDNVSFSEIGSFNYANLFEEEAQRKLISSKLLAETIIQKISENSLEIPNDPTLKLNVNSDRTAWWNLNAGELKYFLNAVGQILSDSEKQNLNVDLDVSSVYEKITNETKRTELFKSYLIAETLTVNFSTLDLFKDSIPTYANSGIDLKAKNLDGSDDRSDWYVIDNSGVARTIEHKELWQLITSIHILLGDDFDVNEDFSIDQVLANEDLMPALNASKVNTKTTVADMLASKIIEEIFKGVVQSLVDGGGVLAAYLNLPVSPNWYLYTTPDGQEHDTKTIIESIYQMQKSGLSYSAVKEIAEAGIGGALTVYNTLKTLNTSELADAFVISRTYQGSIEKFFNGMLADVYGAIYGSFGAYVGMEPWNDVKLVQGDYDALGNDKVAISALLKTNIDNIISNIEKASALLGA